MKLWMKVAALIVASVLLVGCGGNPSSDASAQGGGGQTATESPSEAPSASASAEASAPFEGTWRGDPVTVDFLVANGIDRHDAEIVLSDNDAEESLVSKIQLEGGNWRGFISADGSMEVPAQAGTYTVHGDRIIMHDERFPETRYVYRWSIDGQGRLQIDVVSIENAGDTQGVDDSVFQFALYEATPMERVE
jgi:hypothetical protein